MKKKVYVSVLALLSGVFMSACEDGNINVEQNNVDRPVYSEGADEEEEIGQLTDVSGNLLPVVSGTVTPVNDDEVIEALDATVSGSLIDKESDKVVGEELMALVSSEDEARAVAGQYGIILVTYGQGVATYHTEEDPAAVVQRGRDNGWTPLAVNRTHTLE